MVSRFTAPQQADNQFQLRLLLAFAGMLLGFAILAGRFAWLQVYQHEHFARHSSRCLAQRCCIGADKGWKS